VLLVDDSEEFLTAASKWIAARTTLRFAGTARNGAEALDWLSRSAASLVLMDCFMPVLDGFETTRRIKSSEGAPCVVLLSVHEGSAMEQEAWAAGADGFLAKSDFASRLPDLVRGLSARLRSGKQVEGAVDGAVRSLTEGGNV
jgi:CheY-like chemotaxis protein